MESCIFCKIVAGEVPAHKVYEDERVIAFLDLCPIRPGHTLVIPKKHEPNLQGLDDENYVAVMRAVKALAKKIEVEIKPKRVGLLVMGWDVPHAHVHVVPMHEHGDVTSKILLEKKCGVLSDTELAEMAKLLS